MPALWNVPQLSLHDVATLETIIASSYAVGTSRSRRMPAPSPQVEQSFLLIKKEPESKANHRVTMMGSHESLVTANIIGYYYQHQPCKTNNLLQTSWVTHCNYIASTIQNQLVANCYSIPTRLVTTSYTVTNCY